MSTPPPTARERIVDAAFDLFDADGFEASTVDQIATRAGVSRSTFFRSFATKEDVIFPDHAALQDRIRARMSTAEAGSNIVAVVEAARTVLDHYLAEGDHARSRYRLTRSVPSLRDREVASMQTYQHIFREFIRSWMPPDTASKAGADLRAELMANAVVTAHNAVLRRWLREQSKRPQKEFDEAMAEVVELFVRSGAGGGADETTVVVLRSTRSIETLVPAIQRALTESTRD